MSLEHPATPESEPGLLEQLHERWRTDALNEVKNLVITAGGMGLYTALLSEAGPISALGYSQLAGSAATLYIAKSLGKPVPWKNIFQRSETH